MSTELRCPECEGDGSDCPRCEGTGTLRGIDAFTARQPKLASNPHDELVQFIDRLTDAGGHFADAIGEMNKARRLAVSNTERLKIDDVMRLAADAQELIEWLENRA